ncbi:MAG: hypothetical protein JWN85_3873 [Gammaproteobacteria bacterium]|nr:hypothetical protein [Gammaproteobacteria bacterium]
MSQMKQVLRVGLCALGLIMLCASQAATPPSNPKKTGPHQPSRYTAGAMPAGARNYYATVWGVDGLGTQLAESGQLVRFSYRIVNAALAKPLLDKVSNPSLLDERRHAVLSVPQMEKVGPLRQTGPAEVGKTYWVLFSNRGGVVQPGDRVSVVIGSVRVDGLIVEK